MSDSEPSSPLAIVGMGCLFPRANNPGEFWTNIRDGVDSIGEIPASHWRPGDYFDADPAAPDMTYARRGGFLGPVDFDPLLYGLSPNNLEATDTTQLLGMVVARQALLDAGYSTGRDNLDGRPFDRDRTSVILGVTGTLELVIPLGARLGHPLWRRALDEAGVEAGVAEEVVRRISDSYVPWQENSFPGLLGNVAAGRIANRFDLGGTNCVVDAACASSLSALHLAALELDAGRADMAITGGFDTFNDIFMYMCFSKTPALSPTGDSRPFDAGGDGTILGEGLGAVVLKRLADARRDNDKIYAVIRGIGSSSDGRGNAIYAPSAGGQTRALKNAYHAAGIRPGTIELVEAHGTGTRVGDAVEARALSAVYREDRADDTWCAIGSVKSMIGHTKAAAGVAGLIKVAMALHHKVLPPTLKVERPLDALDPGAAPVYVNTGKRPWIANPRHPRRAAVSAFGFGGSNFHCVLEEAYPAKPAIEWDGQVLLMAFSAGSRRELAAALDGLDADAGPAALRLTAANSLQRFRREAACRLVLAIGRGTDVKRLIEDSRRRLGTDQQRWHLPEGAWFGAGSPPGKLALLFPGQGAQYPGMLLDLACQFPAMQAVLAGADACYGPVPGALRLSGLIYPIPVFTDEARRQQAEVLRRTVYAQPAIGAVSLGALRVLEGFGVGFDAAAGHSFGELTALCAAGRIDEDALHRLAARRGELMQPGAGDHGAMLAVAATAAVIHEILEAEQLDLIIANHNAPRQVVLSGASEQIERAVGLLAKRGIGATRLPVSAAFHSSFVAEAEKPFARFLREIPFREGKVPVYANTTAEPYPVSRDKARELLASQLAQPVEFVAEVENLYTAGVRTFLECGPGNVLTGLAGAILGDRAHAAIAVDASRGRLGGQYDLAAALAQLAALGHEVELARWDEGYSARHPGPESGKPALTISLTGANYVRPRQDAPARKPAAVGKPAGPRPTPPGSAPQVTRATPAMPDPAPRTAPAPGPATVQEAIIALQRMQEQTAELHRHYLAGQEAAQQAILKLLERQSATLVPDPGMPQPARPQVAVPVVPRQEVTGAEAQATAPAAAVKPPATARRDGHALESLLLEVVSDKTGYPVDMLSMEMSLDTDLGIDSIKRVEIFSALQEQLPGSRKIQPADLGTFRLLQHIVEFLLAAEDAAAPAPAGLAGDRLHEPLLEVVADKTGYPVDMLNLDMNLDTDLGIDSIKRVEILSAFQEKLPDAPVVRPEDLATLQTLRQIVEYMEAGSAAAPPAPSPVSDAAADDYTAALLEVVADKTGYPVDMLNLDMHLDSDLGIDSIKRVEILSAFQEKLPDAPAVRPEDLTALQTLRQITGFMERQPAPASTTTVTPSALAADLTGALLEVVAEKTGYPVDMINPDMHLDSDLGIDSIKRVEILSAFQEKMPGAPALRPEDLAALQTLRQIIDFMSAGGPAAVAAGPEPAEEPAISLWAGTPVPVPLPGADLRPAIALTDGATIHITDNGTGLPARLRDELMSRGLDARVIPLETLHPEADASGLVVIAPLRPDPDFNLRAFELVRAYAPELRHSGDRRAALLAGVSCLGGGFGIQPAPGDDPVAAGLAGIVKTADKEWPEVHCKTLDLDWSEEVLPDLAAALADELLRQGPLEVGLRDGQRWTLELEAAPQERAEHEPLAAGDLVVISGGARGVTAEAAVALAGALRVNLLLLGRSPQPGPEPEPAWLQDIDDEAAVKRAIRDHAAGDMTPRDVEARYRGIQAAREIRRTLARVAEQGAGVMYRAADIRDRDCLAAALDEARREYGPVRGLIHGAGVLADRGIEDKTPEQFREVYATKIDGLRALLEAMDLEALRLLFLFSSSTARFGRKGQADYAAANEVLNKTAQRHRALHPDCRVACVNWGPWDGGMVTPRLKQLFAAEGVAVIPLRAGADHLVREINGRGPVETVVLGSAPQGVTAPPAGRAGAAPAVMHTAFERRAGIAEMPVLASHVINGKAVLPVALMVEWFAHGAMHGHPGLRFTGFEDLRVYKGVVLDPGAEAGLTILAGAPREADGRLYVPVELRRGEVLHAGARVLLGGGYEEPGRPAMPAIAADSTLPGVSLYEPGRLFHGPDLQGIITTPHCTRAGISAGVKSAPHPGAWMRQPIRTGWIADPLVLDAAFQLMILWSFEQLGAGSLPSRIAGYSQYRRQYPKDGADVHIAVSATVNSTVRADIEFVDGQGAVIARMHGYECVADASLNEAFRRNSAVEEPQP